MIAKYPTSVRLTHELRTRAHRQAANIKAPVSDVLSAAIDIGLAAIEAKPALVKIRQRDLITGEIDLLIKSAKPSPATPSKKKGK